MELSTHYSQEYEYNLDIFYYKRSAPYRLEHFGQLFIRVDKI